MRFTRRLPAGPRVRESAGGYSRRCPKAVVPSQDDCGAWWGVATASGVSGEGRKAVFTDPRCRTVRDGCKPLHARSSCDGTTALGQRRKYPPALSRTLGPAGEPHPPLLRTCAPGLSPALALMFVWWTGHTQGMVHRIGNEHTH